jgi:hypothetical protein
MWAWHSRHFSDLTIATSIVTPEEAAHVIQAALADCRRVVVDLGGGRDDATRDGTQPAASP